MGDELGADVSYHQMPTEHGIITRSDGESSDVRLRCFDGLLAGKGISDAASDPARVYFE